MPEPLYRSRPSGFEILPASMSDARRIRDNLFVSEGLSNTYLINTSDGRIVVNTGMGFEAPIHKRNFDRIGEAPVRYILLTQGHVDHVGGVDLFREEGTEVVAQAGNAAHQLDDQRIAAFRSARSAFAFSKVIGQSLRHMKEEGGFGTVGQSRPEPTLTFEDQLTIELGGERLELIATPGGETLDSMIIWMPDRGVCFAGNLFSALFGHFPNLVTIRGDRYRDPLKFIESLDRVLALEPELLLVGHHDPVEGKSLVCSELLRLREAVLYVHDETVKGMNAHRNIHQLMQEVKLPRELEVGEGYGKVSWSVRAIWENYAGWFHHDSTTELYGFGPSAIHGDLVELAGGPDALVVRAREKLDTGEPVQAIALSEIVLDVDSENLSALEVNLDAHRRLEAESVNFWLSSWLRKEIDQLSSRIDRMEKT
ncbi:MAG: MBL fold metallo-hydrolase [Myxococcales bacterium]|nr:MBL fold metallo-hydrolase [Myxococcales bacterium]HIK83646.1 MBL fold metallo-hydrolase [Myxococcales bacterium]